MRTKGGLQLKIPQKFFRGNKREKGLMYEFAVRFSVFDNRRALLVKLTRGLSGFWKLSVFLSGFRKNLLYCADA